MLELNFFSKESWDDYIKRLDLHDRQELERSLRNLRREENTVIDLDPKAVNTKPPSLVSLSPNYFGIYRDENGLFSPA